MNEVAESGPRARGRGDAKGRSGAAVEESSRRPRLRDALLAARPIKKPASLLREPQRCPDVPGRDETRVSYPQGAPLRPHSE